MGEGKDPLLVCIAVIKGFGTIQAYPGEPGAMALGAKIIELLGRKSVGIALFTLAYLASLASFRVFLHEHPEARGPILWLAVLTSIVYLAGLAILALYYRGE